MAGLTDLESRLLQEVSTERLWTHAATLAQWEKVSGTPGERAAVDYLQAQLDQLGLKTSRYEFASLLGWPEEATVEVRGPSERTLGAITHAFTPSTDPAGVEAEPVDLGTGDEKAFREPPVAGTDRPPRAAAAPRQV